MNPLRRDLHQANRLSWDAATRVHNSHKLDQAAFLKGGGSTLFPEEQQLLGGVVGRRLVHLLCNSGQDTLSLAALGATVTGVDISGEAIAFAQELSRDAEIPATFVQSDVYDWLAEAPSGSFDLAFSSYGALCWLSNLDLFCREVARVLSPGGRFVSVEFHPMSNCFDDDLRLEHDYFGGDPITWEEGVSDYVGASEGALSPSGFDQAATEFQNPHPVHEFQWTVGDIATAVLQAGLRIEVLKEWPYANGCRIFHEMRELAGRRMVPPERVPSLPLMLGLAAGKG